MSDKKVRALLVIPHKHIEETFIGTSLEELQQAVDGLIELVPDRHGCHILCNEEGKIRGFSLTVFTAVMFLLALFLSSESMMRENLCLLLMMILVPTEKHSMSPCQRKRLLTGVLLFLGLRGDDMVILNTTEDTKRSNIPFFVADKVLSLLSVYQSDSLKDYGSVIIIEAEEELSSIDINAIEFTEKIICGDSVCWHLTIPKSNSFCEEIFLEQQIMSDYLLQECEANKERTVFDYEL